MFYSQMSLVELEREERSLVEQRRKQSMRDLPTPLLYNWGEYTKFIKDIREEIERRLLEIGG